MRIALFTDTYEPDVNGVARTLAKWVKYLESRNIPCKVYAPDHNRMEHVRENMVERFFSIPFMLYPECRLAVPNPVSVRKSLLRFNPTLIHVATPFNMGLFGLRLAKKHDIPLVASYHTHFDRYLSYYRLQWMEPMLWRYMHWFHQDCRKIFVPSRSTLRHLRKKGFENLEVWGRGVDTKRFRPCVKREEVLGSCQADPSKFTILYVGRLAPEKSVDILPETYRRLPSDIRERTQLLVAGDGPLYEEMKAQNMEDSIRYLGFVEGDDLGKLYGAADVFLFPSATETFGNVVLEAMASGTPVIGAAAGGVLDNVRHGETGLLCPPDRVSAFVEAVVALYRDEALRGKIARAGIRHAGEQSWDRIFVRLLKQYEEVSGSAHSA